MNGRLNDKTWADTNGPIQPGEATPERVASELFVHGLLGALDEQGTGATERRVQRVMHAISPPAAIRISSHRFQWRAVAAIAACLSLVVLLFVYEALPLDRTAVAEDAINMAIRASRSPGDQRYEIRIVRDGDGDLPEVAEATIDTRAPNLLLLQAEGPDGRMLIAGRDTDGEWAIRRDGEVERGSDRARGRGIWPRWITSNEQSLFADSIDVFLELLARRYTLSTGETDPEVPSLDHIVGVRKQGGGPFADRVDVFIDRSTNLVERLEMRWSPETQAEMKRRWQERLRDGLQGPEGRGPPPPPPGSEGDAAGLLGAPPPPGGPESRPHGGRDGRGWPDGGKRHERGGDDEGMGRSRERPADCQERTPEEAAEGGPEGATGGPPKSDRCLQPRLRFGGRDMPPPRHAGPPRLFVIERVETPAFDAAWFSPETHVDAVKDATEGSRSKAEE